MEHKEWVGPSYKEGGLALVGYSHHHDGEDHEDLTIKVINELALKPTHAYFSYLRNYFGPSLSPEEFWNNVVFFNYLPNIVGPSDQRYAHGTPEQRHDGAKRFDRITARYKPRHAFILTSRHWAFSECSFSAPEKMPGFEDKGFQYCQANNGRTNIFFLRHPQGARKDVMMGAIEFCVKM